jgi:hypothetical protein
MKGVVEEEVIHYEMMLEKRVTDIEQAIERHFKLIVPAITQSKTDKMMRDIEKTMNKPLFQQKIEQRMIQERFKEDEELRFDDPDVYNI